MMTINRGDAQPGVEVPQAAKFIIIGAELHKSFGELIFNDPGARNFRLLKTPEGELSGMEQWTTMEALIESSLEEHDVVHAVMTHSVVVLTAFRLAVKSGVLRPEQVLLLFLPDKHGMESLHTDVDGRMPNWPRGFFDAHDMQLEAFLGGSRTSIRVPAMQDDEG